MTDYTIIISLVILSGTILTLAHLLRKAYDKIYILETRIRDVKRHWYVDKDCSCRLCRGEDVNSEEEYFNTWIHHNITMAAKYGE